MARAGEQGAVATVHKSENGEGGEDQWLTASAEKRTASSGENRSSRGGGGDLVGGRLGTSSVRTFGGFRRGVAW